MCKLFKGVEKTVTFEQIEKEMNKLSPQKRFNSYQTHNKLEKMATEKDNYHQEIKSFAIENRKDRLASQTDEAQLIEATAVANQKEKELKNSFRDLFINNQ